MTNIKWEGLDNIFLKQNQIQNFRNLLWAIKQLLLRDWVVIFQYILHEGNVTIDFLAKKSALSDNDNFVIFHEASPDMSSILLANIMGVEFVRL